MGSSWEHSKLVDDVLLAIGSLRFIRLWKNATGAARSFDNPDRVISFGLKGSPDLVGFMKGGWFLGIECKTGNAKQSKEQLAFETVTKRFNAIYFVVRSKEEAVHKITETAKAMQAWTE